MESKFKVGNKVKIVDENDHDDNQTDKNSVSIKIKKLWKIQNNV